MNTINDLTKQESNVLALVAQGRRNAEIAQELYLSVHTVETHIYHILKKLNLSSRTEAAIYALKSGLGSKPQFNGTTQDGESTSYYSKGTR
jgi:DNA-binding NarL/FixJ family response regulator